MELKGVEGEVEKRLWFGQNRRQILDFWRTAFICTLLKSGSRVAAVTVDIISMIVYNHEFLLQRRTWLI